MHFEPVRTSHLQVPLHEMTFGNAIKLCEFPEHLYEAGTTETIRAIAGIDSRNFTVQERAFIIVSYSAQANGNPNFDIGEKEHLFDYLQLSEYEKNEIPLGVHFEDVWFIRAMPGYASESIERIVSQGLMPETRLSWWLGGMAAMLRRAKEDWPKYEEMNDTEIDAYHHKRMLTFKEFPETSAMQMLNVFLNGVKKTDHIFMLDFQDAGICWKGVAGSIPPTRFHFNTTVSAGTYKIFGKHDELPDGTGVIL